MTKAELEALAGRFTDTQLCRLLEGEPFSLNEAIDFSCPSLFSAHGTHAWKLTPRGLALADYIRNC